MTFTTPNRNDSPGSAWSAPASYPYPAQSPEPVWGPPAPTVEQLQQFPPFPQPRPRSSGFGQRQLAAMVAVVAVAAGAYYVTHRPHPSPSPSPSPSVGQGSQGQGSQGQGGGTGGQVGGTGGQGGGSASTWPAALADFSALIGTGPGDLTGWNSSPCAVSESTDSHVVLSISCSEPDNVTVRVIEVTSADTVQQLINRAPADGGDVQTWSRNSGPTLGQTITFASSNPAEIVTTFTKYPTIVVDLSGASDAAALDDIWGSAPFPG